jgi:hypothetical protein
MAWGGVSHARAEPSMEARSTARDLANELANEGANAYAERDYTRALTLFARAHRLVPAPTIALFEARTLAQLGRLRDARAAYLRLIGAAQPADAPAPFQAAVELARAELALLEPRIPRLSLVVAGDLSDDAVVLLDDVPLAEPLRHGWLLVDPGAHSLRARTAHAIGARVALDLGEGETKQVRLELPPPARRDPQRTWGAVALGAGGAGLGLGLAAGLVAVDAHREAERACPGNICAEGTPGANAVERFRDWRTVSTIGYAIGGVGLSAGLALILTSGTERDTKVAVVPTLGGARLETAW